MKTKALPETYLKAQAYRACLAEEGEFDDIDEHYDAQGFRKDLGFFKKSYIMSNAPAYAHLKQAWERTATSA